MKEKANEVSSNVKNMFPRRMRVTRSSIYISGAVLIANNLEPDKMFSVY
jgi:hypothetical protein